MPPALQAMLVGKCPIKSSQTILETTNTICHHTEVISLLKTGRFDGGIFVGCDIVELYPSTIIRVGLELLEEKMNRDKTWTKKDLTRQEVLQLAKILVSKPYFQCEEGVFNQSKGTPM